MTIAFVIVVQWVAVMACVFWNVAAVNILKHESNAWGWLPSLAAQISRPSCLLPAAIVLTLAVVIIEFFMVSERGRFITQVICLCLWLAFTTFVLGALLLPLIKKGTVLTVGNAKTATSIAEAILSQGEHGDVLEKYRPYKTTLSNGVWRVEGAISPGMPGGDLPLVEILEKNGRILKIRYGKQ